MTGSAQMDEGKRAWQRFHSRVLYGVMAPLYNAMDWMTFGTWWQLVRRALEYIPEGGRVLEVGFGPGKLHEQLAMRADDCTGLDYSERMCEITQQRLARHGLHSQIVRGSVLEMPFPEGSFDVVTSTFAFSGFVDGERAMHEMARVVADGGRVVLVDIALPDDGNWWGTLLARTWEVMGDLLYDYAELMRKQGLSVVVDEAYGPGEHIRVVVGEK